MPDRVRSGPRTVLLLHSSAGHYGADRQLARIVQGLDPDRYRPVVVLARTGPLAQELREAGMDTRVRELAVLRREVLSPRGLSRLANQLRRDRHELTAIARECDAALVHSNTSVILSGTGAARTLGVPHLMHVREIYHDLRWLWPAHRRRLLRADALACVSGATAAQFPPVPEVQVVADGLAPEQAGSVPSRAQARQALDLPAEAFVCSVLGRLTPWKGQHVLLRALAEPAPAKHGFIGVLAGDAWPGQEARENRLRCLAGELGLGSRARFLGFHQRPSEIYAASDVVVVPSTRPDPLPNAALEAAAQGCCVVASAHGGLPEILRDGQTGVLVAPGDVGALTDALVSLSGDPARRCRLGDAAQQDVRERFSPGLLMRRVQSLYDRLIEDRPSPSAGGQPAP